MRLRSLITVGLALALGVGEVTGADVDYSGTYRAPGECYMQNAKGRHVRCNATNTLTLRRLGDRYSEVRYAFFLNTHMFATTQGGCTVFGMLEPIGLKAQGGRAEEALIPAKEWSSEACELHVRVTPSRIEVIDVGKNGFSCKQYCSYNASLSDPTGFPRKQSPK